MKISISKRFEELIKRGESLYKISHDSNNSNYFSDELFSQAMAWKLSAKNLLRQVYGEDSEHYILFSKIFSNYSEIQRQQYQKGNIAQSVGILKSAKEEFDLGFTHSITHILAVEFFDNVHEQAKELIGKGFKDPSAILGRVIIENTLKDLCERNNIQFKEDEGASSLNEKLKNAGIFNLPQFKLCRTNIELGNDAAHGDFNKYSLEDVKKMFEYIENSLLVL